MLFVLIGAALGLLYVARTILAARSENRSPGFLDQVLIWAMVGVLTVGVTQAASQQDTIVLVVAALGLVFALFSLMTVILGRREENSDDSRGYLGIGTGIIIVGVALGVPLMMSVAPSPTEVAFVLPTAINDVPSAAGGLGNQRLTSNRGRVDLAPTQTPVELSSVIPSPPPSDIYFFTPTPTPEGMACEAVVTTDLNVRRYPSVANNNVVAVAPENKEVMILGRTEETSWWYVRFDIYEGWVDADFVEADEACETIPTRSWS